MKKLLFFLLLLIFCTQFSNSTGLTWTKVNMPYGSAMTGVYKANSGNLYVGTMTTGIFKSSNEGQSWSHIGTGLGSADVKCASKFFTNDEKLIFAFAYNLYFYEKTLYYTTDGGNVWKSINSESGPKEVKKMVLLPNNSVVALEIQTNKLFITSDTCKTWQSITIPGMNDDTICDIFLWNKSKLLAVTKQSGIFYSDGPDVNSWSKLNIQLPATNLKKAALSADNRLLIYTQDRGLFYQNKNSTNFKQLSPEILYNYDDEIFEMEVINNNYLIFKYNNSYNDFNTFNSKLYDESTDQVTGLGLEDVGGVDYSVCDDYLYIVSMSVVSKAKLNPASSLIESEDKKISIIQAKNGWLLQSLDNKNIESVVLYDVTGRVIFETRLSGNCYLIDKKDYQTGIYFVKTITDGNTYMNKIII
jgi:hypothetical protein